jgi:preprotein translocase subunit SecG
MVFAILLIIVILMQRTGVDGVSGISGGSNNMGIVTARSVTNFLTKVTIILAFCFMINSIIIANVASRKNSNLEMKIDTLDEKEKTHLQLKEKTTVPIVK